MLVYQSYYAPNKLLDGRRTSQRLAGGVGALVAETVAVVHHVTFATIQLEAMPAAFIPSSVAGAASDSVYGDIGMPILSRFRLIVNYSRQRLYAIPYGDVTRRPFSQDRLGLVLVAGDAACETRFVAPHSPAEAAGFAVGDKIASIDGRPCATWPQSVLSDLRYRPAGTTVALTMANGSVRRVLLADYF
jgi:membrane-associated protease RseP (regulator of RpoE activity)